MPTHEKSIVKYLTFQYRIWYHHFMQQKSPFIMLALSGSILLVMLFTVLGFTPSTTALQADIVGAEVNINSLGTPM